MNNILSDKNTEAIYDILVEQLGVQRAQLTPNAKFIQDLGADSLTLMEIAMALEDQLNLPLPEEQWDAVSTVGELFDFLAKLPASTDSESAGAAKKNA